jgi:hypothetical protein
MSPDLRYDEIGELMVDEKIREKLGKFDVREKTNFVAFLEGASKPMGLDVVEAIAGKCNGT